MIVWDLFCIIGILIEILRVFCWGGVFAQGVMSLQSGSVYLLQVEYIHVEYFSGLEGRLAFFFPFKVDLRCSCPINK